MKSVVCHELLMPLGSHFSCFAKKSNQMKATPTFALIRDLKRKRRAVRNSLRSNNGPLHRRFHSKSRGRMNRDPSNQYLIASRLERREPGCEHPGYAGWNRLANAIPHKYVLGTGRRREQPVCGDQKWGRRRTCKARKKTLLHNPDLISINEVD